MSPPKATTKTTKKTAKKKPAPKPPGTDELRFMIDSAWERRTMLTPTRWKARRGRRSSA